MTYRLNLIGIGTGNPDHVTFQAAKALNNADLILIPRKGDSKADLADLRRQILAQVLTRDVTLAEFDYPVRDDSGDYAEGVNAWHDALAAVWAETIARHPAAQEVALLVWGDPSLYDSTLRIAARLGAETRVVPGLTSIQVLTAAHGITLNEIGRAVVITTGRQLREAWPAGADTAVIMLDGKCSFQHLDPKGISIWWGAYVGMKEELLIAGPLAEVGAQIIETRARARADHGWIMDIYLLRKDLLIT
ncbi:precorrin-6A synthase (deacetylating) [Rhodobacter sp. KR11]|jgi:precorrin-6A synthase|uniref:precorrin-6A synthase (deacetylating) n=1 Tax=Rhodobacter sp. KR11 TaxID=2974588 RepID=UPI0022238967|nr:precorrin-6A synthase (deacetylating) [Rhodobacter sp. KR11]MCW1919480.1 precorrin-6A synthase (deacetylating) [Rhodobacter sp. KR11]